MINLFKKKRLCPVCRNTFDNFLKIPDYFLNQYKKYNLIHRLEYMETLNTSEYICPKCGILDRDRLITLYLKECFQRNTEGLLLEFAPSPALSHMLKSFPHIEHKTIDLFMENVDIVADIENLNMLKNEYCDFFVCSHVLEHVKNDQLALSELYRILKSDGVGLLLVPIFLGLDKTLEDERFVSVADRWKYYGQDDHVRAYSKFDFVTNIENAGFRVRQLGQTHFGSKVLKKAGVSLSSVLYVVKK